MNERDYIELNHIFYKAGMRLKWNPTKFWKMDF